MKAPPLVLTGWLQSSLERVRIVDCRWVLGKPGEGRRQYEAGHIPGAVHLDMDGDLSGREGSGRHPLPTKRDFQKRMSGIGVSRETHVIAYDEGRGMPAARLWWLLRYFGHEKVSLLDGGWLLWTAEGKAVSTDLPSYPEARFVARPKLRWVMDRQAVEAVRDEPEVLLIDARSPERFRGDVEPVDARAGHIPGAVNFPFTRTIDPMNGRFLPEGDLKARFGELGVAEAETIICYCGSGITACTNIFALNLAGFDAKLYEGSWSDWSRDKNLSAATGAL